MSDVADVVVVGGGPAGAATAYFLAATGVAVTVVDRARFPRDKPCAEYLSPQGSRILELMGALDPVERAGAAHLTGMVVRAPSGDEIHGEFAARHGFRGFRDRGLALRRRHLDTILLDRARAAGARVIEGERVADVARDGTGRVTGVTLVGGDDGAGRPRELAARVVVGADGLRGVVGRRLGLVRQARWPRRIAFVCHYAGFAAVRDYGEMHVERDGFVGIADVGHGETNVAMVVPEREMAEARGDAAGFMERWLMRRPQLRDRLAGAERTSPVRATGPFASSARRAWAPGAALVGDAADFFDPFTGEGIYAALRGGELLAPFVADAAQAPTPAAADRALAAYDARRRAEFKGKWIVEKMIGASVAHPLLINQAARVLSKRKDMADLLVGVTGDFVPASEVLRLGYLARLFMPTWR